MRQVVEEIWNGGDLELADQVFAPDYVNHGGLIPDLVRGPEAIKVSVAVYRLAFPAFRVAVVDVLAQGPSVALRWAAHRFRVMTAGVTRRTATRTRCVG